MKKKIFVGLVFAVIMLAIVLAFISTAKAEEVVITGYGSGETAVKGDIEKQAKIMIESWGNKKPAKIIIKGFADITGKAAENDAIARDRAREMEAFIKENINAEKITARSKGDSENARKVVVYVEFAPPIVEVSAAPEVKKKNEVTNHILFVAISVMIVMFLIVTVRSVRIKKARSEVTPQSFVTISRRPIQVTINGEIYNFYPEVTEDGRFKTFYEIEHGKFMFVSGEKELKKSLKSSLKKDKELLGKLLTQGDKSQPRLEIS